MLQVTTLFFFFLMLAKSTYKANALVNNLSNGWLGQLVNPLIAEKEKTHMNLKTVRLD